LAQCALVIAYARICELRVIVQENRGEAMTDNSCKITETGASQPEFQPDVVAHNQNAASGSSGISIRVDREQEGIPESSLLAVMGRVADSDNKRFSIQVLAQLAVAWTKETNTKFAILNNKKEKLAEEMMLAREEIATLKAANMERDKHVPLVNLALFIGSILVTFGLEKSISGDSGVGIAAALIGGSLIVASLWVQRGSKK